MPLKRAHSDLYLTEEVSHDDVIIYYYEDDMKRRRLAKTQCAYDPRDAIELFEMIERREGFTATPRPLGVPGHRTFLHRHRMFYRKVTVETQEYKSFEKREEAMREACEQMLLWIYYGRSLKNHHVIAAATADAGNSIHNFIPGKGLGPSRRATDFCDDDGEGKVRLGEAGSDVIFESQVRPEIIAKYQCKDPQNIERRTSACEQVDGKMV